jgi:glutamine---fructose-6-phosphate transaminase (isomerizing)
VNPQLFLADLEAKPAVLRELAAELDRVDVWQHVRDARRVVFLGMGSSRYAADVAARALRRRGVAAIADYASVDESLPADDDTLVVAISATGTSVETLAAATPYRGRFVALTNTLDSPLVEMAADAVALRAGIEAGGVACRTFQHTLVLLMALAEIPGGRAALADRVRATAEATADLLDRRDDWLPSALDLLDGPDGVYAIAPAERLSSALQSALMVREGPRRAATGCETGDWAHVDVYLAKTLDYRALLFPGSKYDEQALEWIRLRGSTVVAVGADVPAAALSIRYRGDTDPLVRLFTETLVAELVAATWWAAASS